ncbi:MAG: hypothetical protein WKG07_15790 [Hymenobacter sp.]
MVALVTEGSLAAGDRLSHMLGRLWLGDATAPDYSAGPAIAGAGAGIPVSLRLRPQSLRAANLLARARADSVRTSAGGWQRDTVYHWGAAATAAQSRRAAPYQC